MTPDEVIDLLTLAAAYDRRTVGQADVEAWMDAAHRARWTYREAQEALKAHYAQSTQFLMPGHITERLRVERRQPAPVAGLLGPASPASAETRARVMEMVGESFSLPRDAKAAPVRDDEGRAAARAEIAAVHHQPLPRKEPA